MAKKTTKAPFKDPKIQRKAVEAAKGKKRPNRKSKAALVSEVKKEIIKEELLRQGYLEEVSKAMPKIMKAHIKVASMPRASATQERKLLFEASGLKDKEEDNIGKTIGQVLSELANS